MDAVSSHSYLPVRYNGRENLPTLFVVLIWPCQVVQARGLTLVVIIATGALTHSQRAKVAKMCNVRVTFRFPESRNEPTDVRSTAYSMVVTWMWWVLTLFVVGC